MAETREDSFQPRLTGIAAGTHASELSLFGPEYLTAKQSSNDLGYEEATCSGPPGVETRIVTAQPLKFAVAPASQAQSLNFAWTSKCECRLTGVSEHPVCLGTQIRQVRQPVRFQS